MNLERWLQVHIASICLLGSLFIALNTGNYTVPGWVLFAGATSIVLTDTLKWFRLNRLLGNLAAVGLVVYALRDFLVSGSEGQLLAIASLLVYLQIMLFFQEKNTRLYWQIILLSLLQVVVGAALHLGVSFGVLLLCYTILAVSTLVLFFVHRGNEEHPGTPLLTGPVPGTKSHPWLGRSARVHVSSAEKDIRQAFLSRSLVQQIAFFTAACLLFGAAFFYSVPRHSKAAWAGTRGFSHSETGFSRDVGLQQMGEMLQNNSPVMRVRLSDALGRPIERIEPYFAGEVLTTYRPDDFHATWLAPRRPLSQIDRDRVSMPHAPAASTMLHVEMNATYHNTLFAITPIFAAGQTPDDVRMDPSSRLVFREPQSEVFMAEDYSFEIATGGIRRGRQVAIVPHQFPPRFNVTGTTAQKELNECLVIDRSRLDGLCTIASEALTKLGDSRPSTIIKARVLEDVFLAPGAFNYSLNLNVPRDPQLDPIEDFVVNHRTGHCQYFASALVFMLRSQGIPARMVVGYRGDEYNDIGDFYQVRQRNAHAWVEAYLTQQEVPEYEATAGSVTQDGAWLRLDPTPGRDTVDPATWAGTARDWIDYFDTIWSDYVIGLNQRRQQSTFYTNSAEGGVLGNDWLQPEKWTALLTLASWLGIHIDPESKDGFRIAFDWRAGLTAMVACGLLILLARSLRYYARRIEWSRWFTNSSSRGTRSAVDFYARLEDLLSAKGRSRRPAETAREYVDQAVEELAIRRSDGLEQMVEAFYRVRYGAGQLSEAELTSIENTLSQLAHAPHVEEMVV